MSALSLNTCENMPVKQKAIEFIGQLSDQATWDDIMHELYVRMKIDEGLKAADEGRVVPHDEVKKRFCAK